ncbi:MAG: hypothetical protein II059_06125, partial [Clostridia bacterium]|nr:hypothetical protein [Clostridia bacterium]
SMIATLLICLIVVHIINTDNIEKAYKFPLILLLMFAAQLCDWGANAIYFTLAFELSRNKGRKTQIVAFSVVVLVILLPSIIKIASSFADNGYTIYRFGMFLPVPAILLYNGKRGGSSTSVSKNVSKYFFYAYYPLHILILSLLLIKTR